MLHHIVMLAMMKSPIQLLVAVFLFLSSVNAQEPASSTPISSPTAAPGQPAATATPTPAPAPEVSAVSPTVALAPVFEGHDDLLSLSAAMAAAQFEIRQTVLNQSDLISALSRLVAARCMSNLHRDLGYVPDPKNKECSEAIDYTLSVDPANPEATCAKSGIDSSECRDAFRQQRSTSELAFKDTEGIWMRFQDDVRIRESQLSSDYSKASSDFFSAATGYRNDNNPVNKAKLANAATIMLDRYCATTRIVPNQSYDQERTAQEKALEDSARQNTSGELAKDKYPTFNEMLNKLSNASAGASSTPIPAVTSRFRLIPQSCNSAIMRTFDLLPEFPRAICYRDGFFSPACIIAMRRQKYVESKAPSTASGQPGRPTAARDSPLQTF